MGRAKGLVGGLGYSPLKQAYGLVGWVESEEGISFYILVDLETWGACALV